MYGIFTVGVLYFFFDMICRYKKKLTFGYRERWVQVYSRILEQLNSAKIFKDFLALPKNTTLIMPYGTRSKTTKKCCGQDTYTSADDNHQIPRCKNSGIPAEDCQDFAFKEGEGEESDQETNSAEEDGNETEGDYSPSHSGNDTVSSSPSITGNSTGATVDDIITEDRPAEDGTPADLGFQTQPQHPVTPGPFPAITYDTSTVGTFPHSPIRSEPEHGPEFPATEIKEGNGHELYEGSVEDLTPAVRRLNFNSPSIEERLLGLSKRLATLEAENEALKKKVRRLECPEFSGLGTDEDPIVFLE